MLLCMGLRSWYHRLFLPTAPLASRKETMAAAEHGDPEAQFALGLRYSAGIEAGPDLVQAAYWYRKAADQDHTLAQFHLGIMFANGQGLAQSDATAVLWIRKSAEGGDAGAQFNLGSRYHRHSMDRAQMDCAESRVEAYKWFHLAAAQGYKGSAAACERVALGMTREEVEDGNERVAAFVVRKPRGLPPPACSVTMA